MAFLSFTTTTVLSSTSNNSKGQHAAATGKESSTAKQVKKSSWLNPANPNDTWLIHGKQYRMAEFVPHHPGGLEPIMLGCGRDCTALFESYHPFTQKQRRVLEKYLVKDDNKTEKTVTATKEIRVIGKDWDVFYETMRYRVEQTLREQGLDPLKDRAATWQRYFYYVFIISMVAVTGVAHARVRTSIAHIQPQIFFLFLTGLVSLSWYGRDTYSVAFC
jgi:cytochrome b involved in lipid metabolism